MNLNELFTEVGELCSNEMQEIKGGIMPTDCSSCTNGCLESCKDGCKNSEK